MALKKFAVLLLCICFSMIAVTSVTPAVSVNAITDKSERVEYNYSRQCFYSKPYIFEIGWNISDKTAKSLGSIKVSLSDKTSMTVWYENGLEADMSGKNVTASLADVLERIRAEDNKLSRPVVLSIKDTGNASPEALVSQYYKNNDIVYYAAVLPFADDVTQRAYLKKSYDDNDAAFFSVSLDILGNIGLTKRYLSKSYADDDIALFSICFNSIKDSNETEARTLAGTYAEKAYTDDNYAFFSVVLADETDKNTLKAWYNRASRDGKTTFKAICTCEDWDDWNDDDDFENFISSSDYANYGVTYTDGHYYYNKKPVRYFLDVQRSSSSTVIATVETNPNGKVDIKIVRDKNGNITGVKKLTAEEIQKYFGDTED